MRRRDFIAGLGAAARPLAAKAQQPDKVRRIGVIMGFSVQNSEAGRWVAAFEKIARLSWRSCSRKGITKSPRGTTKKGR
jgi:hypothetical protein